MSHKVLFIGGPIDGERRIMAHTPQYFEVPEIGKLTLPVTVNPSQPPKTTFKTHTYKLHLVVDEFRRELTGLYVHSGISNWKLALVDGYRPSKGAL